MDFSGPGLTYILLVIPVLFALAVVGQGVYKMNREESGGGVAIGFGVVFLLLIATAYIFFIR